MAKKQNLKETTNDAQEQQAVEKNQLPLNLRYDEEVGELIKRNDGSSCYRERCEDNGPQDDERSEGMDTKHSAWLAPLEAWENDSNPTNDTDHKQRIAVTAVVASLPYYEDGENDSSPSAWYRWASEG